MFGFGRRRDEVDIDEIAISQRVEEALARAQIGAEPGIDRVAASGPPTGSAQEAIDYVMAALSRDGINLDRSAVARVLALAQEFAARSVGGGAA